MKFKKAVPSALGLITKPANPNRNFCMQKLVTPLCEYWIFYVYHKQVMYGRMCLPCFEVKVRGQCQGRMFRASHLI